ncbi:hypothetical protein GQ44DRAFT_680007 [Phaeosphaeriaceae sp. PMI808]|nr:hypothetical protein GQ44DRAFT_680007 [Phaeosphaeriaceae sp. PMI808]
MAPPYTTKASSRTSAASRITRKGLQKSQKNFDEGHEELPDLEQAEAMDVDDHSGEKEPHQVSPQELISNMVDGARKRHVAKRKAVIEFYGTTSKKVETTMNTLFNDHEEKASLAHEAELKNLEMLLVHKAKLEGAMESKLKALRKSYDAHSRDLEMVLSRRLKELK